MNIKGAIIALVLLGSCMPDDIVPMAKPRPSLSVTAVPLGMVGVPHWEAPDNYSFTFESSCGERSLIGRFHVEITNGEVSRVRAPGERARTYMRYAEDSGKEVPMLDELWNEANRARNNGADLVTVLLDPDDGHPRSIDIDYNEQAIDDEACYEITNYAATTKCKTVLCISDATVTTGQVVMITFAPPNDQIWGVDAELRPAGRKRVGWLYGRSDDRRMKTVWPSPNLGFHDIGFYGRTEWTWTVPRRLEPGRYEISKESIRDGPDPIEERINEWTVSFEVT